MTDSQYETFVSKSQWVGVQKYKILLLMIAPDDFMRYRWTPERLIPQSDQSCRQFKWHFLRSSGKFGKSSQTVRSKKSKKPFFLSIYHICTPEKLVLSF